MNSEYILLSEISQSQKDNYCMIPLYTRYLEKSNLWRQKVEERFPVAGGEEKGAIV